VQQVGAADREPEVTGEALHRLVRGLRLKVKAKSGEWCEVADEPVVVLKCWPMKAGNGVEDKTDMTTGVFCGAG